MNKPIKEKRKHGPQLEHEKTLEYDKTTYPLSVRFSRKEVAYLDLWCAQNNVSERTEAIRIGVNKLVSRLQIGETNTERSFVDYWDPHEGVYTFKLISDRFVITSDKQDAIRSFSLKYWQFFYRDHDGTAPIRQNVEALWDDIAKYIAESKINFTAAGKAMAAALKKRGITPPEW